MSWKGKKVLITGGAGFMGSHLAEELVSRGADVSIIDLPGTREHLKDAKVKDASFYEIDISNDKQLKTLEVKPEYIFHLAALAYPGDCEKNRELAFKYNAQGTFNVLELARNMDVERVVFNSSAQVYGIHPKYLPIDEKHPVNIGNSTYNYTKLLGEETCQFFYDYYGVPVIYFRLFNSFGERQAKEYFIPTVILQALNNGKIELWNEYPTRDFTYVKDTVNALILGAEIKFSGGPINLGYGKEISIGTLARQIANGFEAEVIFKNIPVTGAMRMLCDTSKAKALLKWEPKTSFENGLKKTIAWYKENKQYYLSNP